jgi:hypothetical protein
LYLLAASLSGLMTDTRRLVRFRAAIAAWIMLLR